jgi:hypothetical protein
MSFFSISNYSKKEITGQSKKKGYRGSLLDKGDQFGLASEPLIRP